MRRPVNRSHLCNRFAAQIVSAAATILWTLQSVCISYAGKPSIQARLAADTALVEFVMYDQLDRDAAPGSRQARAPRYAAYVLTPRGPVQAVDLGEAAAIDQAVQALRMALALHRTDVREAARRLDARVMQPVRALLGDVRRVYLAPDGALRLIPFEALIDEDGRYLVERYSFTYLDSSRELAQHTPREPTSAAVMVVANPDFDVVSRPAGAAAAPVATGPRAHAADSHVFSPLPGTAREAAVLRRLFPAATVLTRGAATEAAVKRARAPFILHIATHGSPIETPRGRPGLALAGANQRRRGTEDGRLTALELSSMDLDGTQLVVLSACNTGAGSASSGQDVLGLRRALVLAGAATQVVSLWGVDDEATSELMAAYYQRLLAGEGRSEALHAAQRALLRTPGRAHPYYWAAFIVWGDPSPLPQRGRVQQHGTAHTHTRPGRLVPHAHQARATLANRVATWIFGQSRRMVRRKTRAAARLLVMSRQGQVQPLASGCIPASALLPARAQPGKIFLVVDGALHVMDVDTPRPVLVPISTAPAGVVFVQLLASSKQVQPNELLALVRPPGARAGDTSTQLWRFVITGDRATGEPVLDAPWLRSRETFFARFSAPRCRDDGSDCLVIANSSDGASLDIQPRPRAARRAWTELDADHVHDAAWQTSAPASAGAALALVTCEKEAP